MTADRTPLAPDLAHILAQPTLFVRQEKEWAEILIDWETRNRYAVLSREQEQLALVAERAGGCSDQLNRWFLRSHRPLHVELLTREGHSLLQLQRGFFWFFSDLFVTAGQTPLGSLHRRFRVLARRYDLCNADGTPFAHIHSGVFRIWTFPILDQDGEERARITKRWGGALREWFTDADTYQVDFGAGNWTPAQRAVILAAAISIDFDFFEENQANRRGLLGGDGD